MIKENVTFVQVLNSQFNKDVGMRANVRRELIVVSFAQSSTFFSITYNATVDALRGSSTFAIDTFAIGASSQANYNELYVVASVPKFQRIYQVTNTAQLNDASVNLVSQLLAQLCPNGIKSNCTLIFF
jgi:hypothetical protein